MESEQRPWGAWHVLDEGRGYKVKRIEVRPGQRLSYQVHEQRSEHWTVVQGTATCTLDGETFEVEVGGSIDVGIGTAHRVANLHDEDLVLIEVQRGDYTGEDDIVRLDDDYGRDAGSLAR
ncbi:MAG TPA: phosphomannose isomerase type II C-terminal cupin domain [Nocardioides sp.]|jgi:mannose-6-phosphate isomerase-like protein (cupin superfamily)|nr:phosphomannose isomerase type II C-terminal cupin domain [Nocardioides sp.]